MLGGGRVGGWNKGLLDRGEREAHLRQPPPHHQPALTHLAQVSPLYLACSHVKTEFALALLRAGALPDLATRGSEDGRLSTPLLHAAFDPNHRGAELCKALLDAGATVGLGRSPLDFIDMMNPEVVKMITGGLR